MMVKSPCISICSIEEATGYCKGCYRTVQEVGEWLYYSDSQKKQVLTQIDLRKNAQK